VVPIPTVFGLLVWGRCKTLRLYRARSAQSAGRRRFAECLVVWLRDKCALTVIDNCEHVVCAAAATSEAMLKAAPQLAILVTSREPLRAEGEWLLRLPSLTVPPERSGLTGAEAQSFPAVELFNERAVATLDGFDLADADIPVALEICRRLDGVPLALELAAAQVDVFGVRGLAAHLDDRLAVLTRGRRTAVPRQQTLGRQSIGAMNY
jgi:predicted ATPase